MAEQPEVQATTASPDPLGTLIGRLSSLSVAKQISLLVSIAAVVAMTVGLLLWSGKSDYTLLFGSMDAKEMQTVVEYLEQNKVDYKIDPSSGAVLVPKDEVYKLRLKLAAAGLPKSAPTGYQLLDKDQGFGVSQFRETTQYKRALEGELARSIESIDAIASAKVMLGLPKRSVFVRKQEPAKASVVVRLRPGRQLTPEQVNAIVYLVAASVPNLSPKNVTVVDQYGNLLSDNQAGQMRVSLKQLDYTRTVEQTLSRRIIDVLAPVVGGASRVRAQVTADIDFTQQEQTRENYEPDPMAIRSEQVIKELDRDKGPQGIPGALTNQPPRAGIAPETGYTGTDVAEANAKRLKEKTTRNYEIDRTVSHVKSQIGTIRRLSVAVVLDDKTQVDEQSGEVKRVPWAPEELDRFKKLVSDAVALEPARGDTLSVLNASFVKQEALEEVPIWQEPWFIDLVKQGLAVLGVLVVLFGVIRPMIKDLTKPDETLQIEYPEELEAEEAEETLENLEEIHKALEQIDESVEQTVEEIAHGTDEEQQLMEKVRSIVQNDPKGVAHILKQWLQED
ncbi:flagellar M-ring protein FliF [Sulfurivirga caldicuralii]|uniref:Flagellar M-ring protein n=1 Tax=Sulfurivirga caldicuralii TaxID=364032 RepID=A0A1N6FM58_9GAMM|nr:flagellar basal-body MS-ring/collar protein FliF [Sulfurivirga caldicuralii]SIN96369.1 flagellar M-ring protein FliF [Sulfurivirga caldicuralii]